MAMSELVSVNRSSSRSNSCGRSFVDICSLFIWDASEVVCGVKSMTTANMEVKTACLSID